MASHFIFHQEQTYLKDRVDVYVERARRVSDVCLRHRNTLIKPTVLRTLAWYTMHRPNLVWCEISKAGSKKPNVGLQILMCGQS